jgi:hypothetical protein
MSIAPCPGLTGEPGQIAAAVVARPGAAKFPRFPRDSSTGELRLRGLTFLRKCIARELPDLFLPRRVDRVARKQESRLFFEPPWKCARGLFTITRGVVGSQKRRPSASSLAYGPPFPRSNLPTGSSSPTFEGSNICRISIYKKVREEGRVLAGAFDESTFSAHAPLVERSPTTGSRSYVPIRTERRSLCAPRSRPTRPTRPTGPLRGGTHSARIGHEGGNSSAPRGV